MCRKTYDDGLVQLKLVGDELIIYKPPTKSTSMFRVYFIYNVSTMFLPLFSSSWWFYKNTKGTGVVSCVAITTQQ